MDKALRILELSLRIFEIITRAIESGVKVNDRIKTLTSQVSKMRQAGREPTDSELSALEAAIHSHDDEIQRRVKEIKTKTKTSTPAK